MRINFFLTESLVANEAEDITNKIIALIKSGLKARKVNSIYKTNTENKALLAKKIAKEKGIKNPIENLGKRKTEGTFTTSITAFFSQFNKNKTTIILKLINNKPTESSYASVTPYGNKIILSYHTPFKFNESSFYDMRPVLFHEVIHVIDFLRNGNRSFTRDSYKKSSLGYLNDTIEFNRLVNEITHYYNNDPVFKGMTDRSKNINDFILNALVLVKYPVQSDTEKKILLKDQSFKKKLITRLTREGLTFNFR